MDELAQLARAFDESGYARLLGMRVAEVSRGRARVALEIKPEHLNSARLVHGGLIMSLADHAFGCATNSLDRPYVGAHFGVTLLAAPAVGTTLYAEAEVLRAGRRAGTAEVAVRDAAGKLVAKALGTVIAVGEAHTADTSRGDPPRPGPSTG